MGKKAGSTPPAGQVPLDLGATGDPLGEVSSEPSRGARGGLESLWRGFRAEIERKRRFRELNEKSRTSVQVVDVATDEESDE